MSKAALLFRPPKPEDRSRLQEVRQAAFAPVFASFRSILGDEIYRLAQERDDQAQSGLLDTILELGSCWEVHVAELDGVVVGFVSVKLDTTTQIGEIGLNAVHPDHAGRGVGTAMYELALERMRAAGIRVATVGTGGDPSHEPARRAYEKAGFDRSIPSVWFYRLV